jgi:hypothetical protein
MADENQEIAAYLNGHGGGHTLFFTIFPDWTPEDYEEVCTRIKEALTSVGISFSDSFPRFSVKNGRVASNASYRKRIAAENLLFGHYNQDGLLLLPHQKDPSTPRPPWFQDHMLVPGPYSLGQKLLIISFRKIKDRITGRRGTQTLQIAQTGRRALSATHLPDRMSSPTESEDTLTTQDVASISSAGVKQGSVAIKQRSPSSTVANTDTSPTPNHNNALTDLTIHIGTIFELEEQLIMRRTFRDPKSWVKSSAPGIFDFEKVCHSVGVTGGWEKELFFFPDMNKDPHSILDEDELQGEMQYLCTQNAKEGTTRSISFFVAADIDHVRALSLDQRGKSSLDTISSR